MAFLNQRAGRWSLRHNIKARQVRTTTSQKWEAVPLSAIHPKSMSLKYEARQVHGNINLLFDEAAMVPLPPSPSLPC